MTKSFTQLLNLLLHGQLALFDAEEAERRRDLGVESVRETFVEAMRRVAIQMSDTEGQVSSDDLRRHAKERGISPKHPNAWGVIFRGKGWTCVGRMKSSLVSNHAREIRIWKWTGSEESE